jgi:hypothetical protein
MKINCLMILVSCITFGSQAKAQYMANTSLPPDYRKELDLQSNPLSNTFNTCLQSTLNHDKDLSICSNMDSFWGIQLKNSRSPRINPNGNGVYRRYQFSAEQKSRQETYLEIEEVGIADPMVGDSHKTMESVLIFLPRKVLPSIKIGKMPNGQTAYRITLPTGEPVVFDALTKEIIAGVLEETGPIDTNPDRFKRQFAALKYTGSGVVIRGDQRGETPKSAVVWGAKKTMLAEWNGQKCTIPTGEIFEQNAANEGGNCRFATDSAFYAFLKTKCGWDISAASFP